MQLSPEWIALICIKMQLLRYYPYFYINQVKVSFLYSKVSTHDPTQLLPGEICCHYFVLVLVINTLPKCSSWCSRGGHKIRILDVKWDFLAKRIWIVIKYLQVHFLNCLCSRNATKCQNTINIYCCFIDHRYCQNVAICFIYILWFCANMNPY